MSWLALVPGLPLQACFQPRVSILHDIVLHGRVQQWSCRSNIRWQLCRGQPLQRCFSFGVRKLRQLDLRDQLGDCYSIQPGRLEQLKSFNDLGLMSLGHAIEQSLQCGSILSIRHKSSVLTWEHKSEAVANRHEPSTSTTSHQIPFTTPSQGQRLASHITESQYSWMQTRHCFSVGVSMTIKGKPKLFCGGHRFLDVYCEVLESIVSARIATHESVLSLGRHVRHVTITKIHRWRSERVV